MLARSNVSHTSASWRELAQEWWHSEVEISASDIYDFLFRCTLGKIQLMKFIDELQLNKVERFNDYRAGERVGQFNMSTNFTNDKSDSVW